MKLYDLFDMCAYRTDYKQIGDSVNYAIDEDVANQWTKLYVVCKCTANGGQNNLYYDVHNQSSYQVGDVIKTKEYQKIDLTTGFGAGNEPTTIDDPRIQKILEEGYIEYDTTGTLVKSGSLPNLELNIKCK